MCPIDARSRDRFEPFPERPRGHVAQAAHAGRSSSLSSASSVAAGDGELAEPQHRRQRVNRPRLLTRHSRLKLASVSTRHCQPSAAR